MLPNKKFAFFLLIAASPFALAAPATHVPFVPSTVQNPESHAGRFGLMTTVSYGRYGQKTTSTQVIDLDAYIKSGATKLVVGVAAANLAATASKACMAAGLDGTCDDPGNGNGTDNTDAGGNTGTTGSDGSYGAGRGPSSSAPKSPSAPDSPDLPWDTVSVTYTQIYDHGQRQQTTTYNRVATPDGHGGGLDTPWVPPVVVQSPVKH